MNSEIQMKGFRELDAYLGALPINMQKNAIRQALTAAARPVRDEARLRAPKKSGKLARAINTGSARRNEDGTFSISVRLTGNDHAFLGYFFEYGVRPHFIRVSTAQLDALDASLKPQKSGRRRGTKALMKRLNDKVRNESLVIGGNFVGPVIHHPGFRAQPFLVPALDTRADDAIAAFAGGIRKYLEGVKAKTGYDVVGGLAEAA